MPDIQNHSFCADQSLPLTREACTQDSTWSALSLEGVYLKICSNTEYKEKNKWLKQLSVRLTTAFPSGWTTCPAPASSPAPLPPPSTTSASSRSRTTLLRLLSLLNACAPLLYIGVTMLNFPPVCSGGSFCVSLPGQVARALILLPYKFWQESPWYSPR